MWFDNVQYTDNKLVHILYVHIISVNYALLFWYVIFERLIIFTSPSIISKSFNYSILTYDFRHCTPYIVSKPAIIVLICTSAPPIDFLRYLCESAKRESTS